MTLTSVELNKLCNDSLNEAVKNFQSSINASILDLSLTTITNQKWSSKRLRPVNNMENRLDSFQQSLKTSYISHDSFHQNKAEPMFRQNATTTKPVNNFLFVTNLINQIGQPSFKR